MERADNVARFIEVNLNLMLDADVGEGQQWMPLVSTSGDFEQFKERYGLANQDNVIQFLAFDKKNPNSILSCLGNARENARTVREIIPSSLWQQINEFYLFLRDTSDSLDSIESLSRLFQQIRRGAATYMGLADSSMIRGEAWHFAHLGRMLERADKTSRILDVKYFILLPSAQEIGAPIDSIQWAAVLRSASAFEMYRKQCGRVMPKRVVEFLLFDHAFPRSARYCLDRARESLYSITGTPELQVRYSSERVLGALCSDLLYTRVETVIESGLHEYLDNLQTKLNKVGAKIHNQFFARKAPVTTQQNLYLAGSEIQDVFTGGQSQIQ